MINVAPVWNQGITGAGISIRINDEGVDFNHTEFVGKFDFDASCEVYEPQSPTALHGTTTASIAAANGDNDSCAVGIAPGANISSCRNDANSFPAGQTEHLDKQDVSSNSIAVPGCYRNKRRQLEEEEECPFVNGTVGSPCSTCNFAEQPLSSDCQDSIVNYCRLPPNYASDTGCMKFLELFTDCDFGALSEVLQEQLVRGVTEGRNGKGLVFVFGAGKWYADGNSVSYSGYANSRYTISVGAVDQSGMHAPYSDTG